MAWVQGFVGVDSIDRERKDIDVATEIAELEPDDTPFMTLLMRARKRPTRTIKLEWFSDRPEAVFSRINNAAGYDTAAVQFVVDDASVYKHKDLVYNMRTQEIYFLDQVPDYTGNTIHVVRNFGDLPAPLALQDNDILLRLDVAMEEFSKAPETRQSQPTMCDNLVMVTRTPFDQSMESDEEALAVGGNERDRLRDKFMFEHRRGLERLTIFSQKKNDPVAKRRATAGLLAQLKPLGNIIDLSGQELTETIFEDDVLAPAFKYGSDTKLMVASRTFASKINRFAAGKIQTTSGEDTYGIKLKEYLSFHGRLLFAVTKTFNDIAEDYALILDMKNIKYRPLRNEDTRLRPDIHAREELGWRDEYVTAFAVQVDFPETHTWVKNIQL